MFVEFSHSAIDCATQSSRSSLSTRATKAFASSGVGGAGFAGGATSPTPPPTDGVSGVVGADLDPPHATAIATVNSAVDRVRIAGKLRRTPAGINLGHHTFPTQCAP